MKEWTLLSNVFNWVYDENIQHPFSVQLVNYRRLTLFPDPIQRPAVFSAASIRYR